MAELNIDWDEVLDETAITPRSTLVEALGHADEITDLILIYNTADGSQYVGSQTQSRAMAIAMLALAQYKVLKETNEVAEK